MKLKETNMDGDIAKVQRVVTAAASEPTKKSHSSSFPRFHKR